MEANAAVVNAETSKEEGSKFVRYVGASDEQVRWGGNDDPRGLLTDGGTYQIKRVEEHSWHTKYELVAFPGKVFNSVCFVEV